MLGCPCWSRSEEVLAVQIDVLDLHQIMEAGLPIRHSVAHVGSQNDLALLGHHLEPFPDNVHVLRARRETAVIEVCLR